MKLHYVIHFPLSLFRCYLFKKQLLIFSCRIFIKFSSHSINWISPRLVYSLFYCLTFSFVFFFFLSYFASPFLLFLHSFHHFFLFHFFVLSLPCIFILFLSFSFLFPLHLITTSNKSVLFSIITRFSLHKFPSATKTTPSTPYPFSFPLFTPSSPLLIGSTPH